MVYILSIISIFFLSSCAQQLLLRQNDFLTPEVSSQLFSGKIGYGVESPTGIEFYQSNDRNFPHKTPTVSNNVPSIIGYTTASLVFLPHIEFYYLDKYLGGKWQFLSLGETSQWLASIKLGRGRFSQTNVLSYDNATNATYAVEGTEAGISAGYKFDHFTGYLSFVEHKYDVVSHNSRASGVDHGTHKNVSIGLSFSAEKDFLFFNKIGLITELTGQNIFWDTMGKSEFKLSPGLMMNLSW